MEQADGHRERSGGPASGTSAIGPAMPRLHSKFIRGDVLTAPEPCSRMQLTARNSIGGATMHCPAGGAPSPIALCTTAMES